jgi:hypothetical protein
MGKFKREEDEADKWLREHDPFYSDRSRSKKSGAYYETPKMEERRRLKEIPMSSLSLRQRDRCNGLSTFSDDFIG